jgi:hypothetical protein
VRRHFCIIVHDEEKDEQPVPDEKVVDDVSRTTPEETPVRFLLAGKDDPVEGTKPH